MNYVCRVTEIMHHVHRIVNSLHFYMCDIFTHTGDIILLSDVAVVKLKRTSNQMQILH